MPSMINTGFVFDKNVSDTKVLAQLFHLLKVQECVVKNNCEKISIDALLQRMKNSNEEQNFNLLLHGFELDVNLGNCLKSSLSKEEDDKKKCFLFCFDTADLIEGNLHSKKHKTSMIEAENNIVAFMRKMLSIENFQFAFCDSDASLFDVSGKDFQEACSTFALVVCKDENGKIQEFKNSWHIDGMTERAFKCDERIYEEKVLAFFEERIPEIANFTKTAFDLYGETESAGLYIVVGHNVIDYFDAIVSKNDQKAIAHFFEVWLEFTKVFAADHHKFERETIQNFTRVALFEEIQGFENSAQIANLLPKELKEDYDLCWN